ncbi:hypothetical protein V5799_000367 [Amblyomma americanum]|uniref:Uncharacterized protein n=1 Tax=Amblyomma americanum TaxID=6943 RepID=A0AAQ4D396_AMBAM
MSSEDSHKKYARKRSFRNQPAKKIGDYGYVLEKEADNLQYWRCEYVSCPGRCRTDRNFRVVAGPSRHKQELHDQHHSAVSSGTENSNGASTSMAMQLYRTITGKGVREDSKGGTQETNSEVPARREQNREQEKRKRKLLQEEGQREDLRVEKRHHRSGSPVGELSVTDLTNSHPHVLPDRHIKQEPPSPSPQAFAVSHETSDAFCHSDGLESDDDRSTVSFEGDDADEKSTLGPEAADNNVSRAVQRRAQGKTEEGGRKSAGDDCKRQSRVSADCEHNNRPLNAKRKPSQATANIRAKPASGSEGNRPETSASHEGETTNEADDKRSHESASRSLADSPEPDTRHRGHRAEQPRESRATSDSRERDLRAAVLIRMRRLLEAETELVNQERCNEALRGMLLERQMRGIVSKTEPFLPFK